MYAAFKMSKCLAWIKIFSQTLQNLNINFCSFEQKVLIFNIVFSASLIASAMILVQQNECTSTKMKHFRELYAKVISDKHEDAIAKFGAIIAQGIIDGGGRNVTLSLQSRTGHTNMLGVVGTLVFCQFWYWYPLTHFLALAFTPTCLIALNSDLQMPDMQIR